MSNTGMNTIAQDAMISGPKFVSISVSFGPAFSEKKLTNKEFAEKLRDEAKKHKKSFLSPMMSHFADHLEAAFSSGVIAPEDQADMNPNTQYLGQGSCTGCPGDDGTGADCCLCQYNGVNVGCENCN